MRSLKLSKVFLCCLLSLLSAASALAAWSEPVHLSELNNPQEQTIASYPCISSDGLSIFFVRNEPSLAPGGPAPYYIIEATRSSVDELFSSQRVLTELGNGSYVASPWISQDGLRLYYAVAEFYQGRWQRLIKMAVRDSVGQHWVVSQTFYEIHGTYIDTDVSLNADENLIMWTDFNLSGEWRIVTATRSEMGQSFSDINEMVALNELNARGPYMSSDGLTVYFHITNADGFAELWSGARASLDEPFGDFLPIDAINQPETNLHSACISPDGSALYFFKGSPTMEQMDKGIYVSYWVETPYEFAMRNLDEAVEAKQQALLLLDEAAEKEIAAVKALCEAAPEDLPQGVTGKQLRGARIAIYHALQRQFIAKKNLYQALNDLGEALGILDPSTVDEVPESGITQETGRKSVTAAPKSNPKQNSKRINHD